MNIKKNKVKNYYAKFITVQIITLARFIATILLFYACGVPTKLSTITILFYVSLLTDLFDGNLARHWQVTSKIGKWFDKGTDGLLILATLALLLIYDLMALYWIIIGSILLISLSIWSLLSNVKKKKTEDLRYVINSTFTGICLLFVFITFAKQTFSTFEISLLVTLAILFALMFKFDEYFSLIKKYWKKLF